MCCVRYLFLAPLGVNPQFVQGWRLFGATKTQNDLINFWLIFKVLTVFRYFFSVSHNCSSIFCISVFPYFWFRFNDAFKWFCHNFHSANDICPMGNLPSLITYAHNICRSFHCFEIEAPTSKNHISYLICWASKLHFKRFCMEMGTVVGKYRSLSSICPKS